MLTCLHRLERHGIDLVPARRARLPRPPRPHVLLPGPGEVAQLRQRLRNQPVEPVARQETGDRVAERHRDRPPERHRIERKAPADHLDLDVGSAGADEVDDGGRQLELPEAMRGAVAILYPGREPGFLQRDGKEHHLGAGGVVDWHVLERGADEGREAVVRRHWLSFVM